MNKRTFSELPANYQQGCCRIEAKCKEALAKSKMPVDKISWDNVNLMACHLTIHAFNRRFDTKFGKLAILSAENPYMQSSIDCKLQFLIDELINTRRRSNIQSKT